MALLESPLHDRHVALGAKFAEFGGWSMPLEYPSGVVKEHTAVREAVGIFDVSHLGKAMVSGAGAAAYVNATLSNDLGKIEPGKAQYTLCCDDDHGRRRRRPDRLLPRRRARAARAQRRQHRRGGPPPRRVGPGRCQGRRPPHRVRRPRGAGHARPTRCSRPSGCRRATTTCPSSRPTSAAPDVVVCRTGYTGERGYELIARNEVAGELWDALAGGGRGARHPRRAGWAPATRCAPRWATRCTARTSASTSRPTRPAWAGPSAGRRSVLGARRADGREGGRAEAPAARARSPTAAASRARG